MRLFALLTAVVMAAGPALAAPTWTVDKDA